MKIIGIQFASNQVVQLLECCIKGDKECDVIGKSISEDILAVISNLLTLTPEAETGVEVEYNGATLHWCGLINHCPLPHYGWRSCFVYVWNSVLDSMQCSVLKPVSLLAHWREEKF